MGREPPSHLLVRGASTTACARSSESTTRAARRVLPRARSDVRRRVDALLAGVAALGDAPAGVGQASTQGGACGSVLRPSCVSHVTSFGVSPFHLVLPRAESAVSSWSQRFGVGVVGVESAPSGWSQVFWVGVSVESARSHWSQLLQLESAWSQVFWVGVSVESALSHWSQPLQLESAWSQQLRSLHAGASWSGMEPAAPARSGSLRLAPQRSERSCVGAGFGGLVMWALL